MGALQQPGQPGSPRVRQPGRGVAAVQQPAAALTRRFINWRPPRVLLTLTAPTSACFLPWLVSKPCGGRRAGSGGAGLHRCIRKAGSSGASLLLLQACAAGSGQLLMARCMKAVRLRCAPSTRLDAGLPWPRKRQASSAAKLTFCRASQPSPHAAAENKQGTVALLVHASLARTDRGGSRTQQQLMSGRADGSSVRLHVPACGRH